MRRTLVALVIAAACSGSPKPPPAPPPAPPAAAPAPTPPPPPAPTFAGVPDTPEGRELAWVLDLIVNRGGAVDTAAVEAHFHPSFLAKVPAAQLVAGFTQAAAQLAGATVTDAKADGDKLVVKLVAGDTRLRAAIALDPTTRQIAGLKITPDLDAGPKPTSFDEVAAQLRALAPKAQFGVSALERGTCKPLHGASQASELAIGSAFKLYVLLALADRIAAGKAAWTDELAVRDDWKSLPSGTTQNDAAGTKLTLQTLAERMISISDNTATDHLLYFLGRRTVEAALRTAHHTRPALDTPFLSTRELFLLKLGAPDELARYLALPEAKRRDHLDRTLAGKLPELAGAAAWTTARRIDAAEWFANADDLCRVMAALWSRGQQPKTAPLLDVLSKNPGLPIDKAAFPYIGFKGGSEPGVLNLTYLLRRADDRWFVASFTVNSDEGGKIEEAKLFSTVAGALELLGVAR